MIIMRKKLKIKRLCIIAVIIIFFLLIPFNKKEYDDGGSVEYAAVLWSYTRYHRYVEKNASVEDSWYVSTGTKVRILWFTVYNDYPAETHLATY